MEKIPQMVDMAINSEDEGDGLPEAVNLRIPQQYPYGLNICLNDQSLEKLNMEDDCEVGDHVHFHCLAKVTSVSNNENMGKRVELQITAMSAENEEEENAAAEEEMERPKISHKKMYSEDY